MRGAASARRETVDELKKKYKSAKRSELFKGLPSFVSKEVLSSAHSRDFAAGEFIYFAGDPMKQLLLLTDGRVKKSHLIESGGEVIIRLTVPGEVISDPAWAPGRSEERRVGRECRSRWSR